MYSKLVISRKKLSVCGVIHSKKRVRICNTSVVGGIHVNWQYKTTLCALKLSMKMIDDTKFVISL